MLVLDTVGAHLLHETGISPVAYIPLTDIDGDLLERSETTSHCPFKGDARTGRCAPATSCAPTRSGPTRSRCPRRPGCAASPRVLRPARWWHVHAGGETFPDAAHSYELPCAEAMRIAGLVCFSGEGRSVELDA